MAHIISYETFMKRRAKQEIQLEQERRRRSINRLIGYSKEHANWDNNDTDNNR